MHAHGVRHEPFQTNTALKSCDRFFYFTYSLYRVGDKCVFCSSRITENSGCYGNLYLPENDNGKMEIGNLC